MDVVEEILVTVTVPIFNSRDYVQECLNYLSKQTFKRFEILFVIDNRTTDDSEKLILSDDHFDNIRIVKQNDGKGLAGARNIGIIESKGKIIWFLDVDDEPHPDFLKDLLSVMEKTDADTVICNNIQRLERRKIHNDDEDHQFIVVDSDYAVQHYRDFPIYSWSRIQRKSVFNEDSMFRERPAAEDIEQTIRQFVTSNKICYYNRPLYTYIKRTKTATKKNRIKELISLEETARSLLPFIKEKKPNSYSVFRVEFLHNMIRQSTFSKYGDYKDWYANTVCRCCINELEKKSIEMKIFMSSKLLYYVILYPFSHFIWDRKTGNWNKNGNLKG